ncbi:MAG: cobalt transporter CbiM [Desulfovibrionaceae bacterium]
MHISEGVLGVPVLAAGAAVAVAGTAMGLRRIDYDRLMTVALMSATFFVASLIHVPLGPSSAHLVLNGLLGALLGWAAFPAILVALLLQAVLFQFGGITVLGVNTCTMAIPAVVSFYLFRPLMRGSGVQLALGAFGCGFGSFLLAAVLTSGALALSGEAFGAAARIVLVTQIPVMVLEGFVTVFVVTFLAKVRPEVLSFRMAG